MRLLEKKELNFTPIFLIGNAVLLSLVLLIEIINFARVGTIANSKAPTLVELNDGESIRVRAIHSESRSAQAIRYFVGQTMTGLLSWNTLPKVTGDYDADPTKKLKLDAGVQTGNSKITTNVWVTGFALSEDFRAEFLKEIGNLTPPDVFNGTTQSILKISLLSEPKKVKPGKFQVDMVGEVIVFQGNNMVGEPIGFNTRNPSPPRINTPTTRSLAVSQLQPQPKQVARVIPNASSAVKTQQLDPMQQWLAVANVGSFSSSVNSDDEQLNPSGIKGGIGSSTEVKNQTTAQTTDYNTKRILVGSTTEGRLETPIFWRTNDDIGQNYLIKISLPLKASDGSEVLPTGSYLVAQLTNSNGSGFAQLRGVSVLINSDGNTQEKKLPENAVLIMRKNGSFLKAESRKGSNLGGDLMSSVIAGVAKAAEIQNRPTSQINISSISSNEPIPLFKKNLLRSVKCP
jgi:hypothetical protein